MQQDSTGTAAQAEKQGSSTNPDKQNSGATSSQHELALNQELEQLRFEISDYQQKLLHQTEQVETLQVQVQSQSEELDQHKQSAEKQKTVV